ESELPEVGASNTLLLGRIDETQALLVRPGVLAEAVADGVERAAEQRAVIGAVGGEQQRARHAAPVARRDPVGPLVRRRRRVGPAVPVGAGSRHHPVVALLVT